MLSLCIKLGFIINTYSSRLLACTFVNITYLFTFKTYLPPSTAGVTTGLVLLCATHCCWTRENAATASVSIFTPNVNGLKNWQSIWYYNLLSSWWVECVAKRIKFLHLDQHHANLTEVVAFNNCCSIIFVECNTVVS